MAVTCGVAIATTGNEKGIGKVIISHVEDLETREPDWLVDGMIPRKGIGFVWGPSYSGKSLLVNSELTMMIANGLPFAGHRTKQGPVIIIFGEGGDDYQVLSHARIERQVRDREALKRSLSDEDRDMYFPEISDCDNIGVSYRTFDIPLGYHGEPTISLKAMVSGLKSIKPSLIILDTITDFSELSISNDASANRVVQGMKYMAAELDCAILAVAHPTYNDKKMRGPQLFNKADFVWRLIPDEDKKGGVVVCEKVKRAEPFVPFSFSLEKIEFTEVGDNEQKIEQKSVTARIAEAPSGAEGGLRRRRL